VNPTESERVMLRAFYLRARVIQSSSMAGGKALNEFEGPYHVMSWLWRELSTRSQSELIGLAMAGIIDRAGIEVPPVDTASGGIAGLTT